MRKLVAILSSCAMLLLPEIGSAQNATLEICNKGRVDIHVAVASRIQKFITGYKWTTQGWYAVAAGKCETVYDEEYDAAGPYTPQSGARVAFIVTRTDGVWGAFQSSDVQGTGWMRSGTGQLCVNRTDAFTFEEPAGDPAANCGGILIPVANDFMPSGPGDFTYSMNWDGHGDFVALGKGGQPRSTVANAGASDSVDNSLGSQFVRALGQAAKDNSTNGSANAPKNAAPTAPPGRPSIRYLCFSTDPKQPAYISDVFDLPDAGSKSDNFIEYERTKIHFALYLVENYTYPDDENFVECGWMNSPTTASEAAASSAAMAAKKKSAVAQAAAAKRRVIETGWKDTEQQVANNPRADASGRADTLRWVRQELTNDIEASKTGFDAYKSGAMQLSQGYRMWTSSEKPSVATGCWVIQGDSTSTLSCVIPVNGSTERADYNELTNDVTASLPADWRVVPGAPFGGSLPSTGYRSSTGAHGEIWLVETPDQNYELHYQLVSAPTASHASKPDDDDPIGQGGLITPPTPPAPPAPPY